MRGAGTAVCARRRTCSSASLSSTRSCRPRFLLARVSLADPQRSPSSRHRALSLGAQFVFVGRPWVYGMSINGAAGVRHVMRALLAEYDILLNVAGWTSTDEVKREGRKYLVRTGAGGGFKL